MNIVGSKFRVTFGNTTAILHIKSETSITFAITKKDGEVVDTTESVTVNMTELRPLLYMVTWQESSGTTVTQVHDYEKGTIYSNWTTPDGAFKNLQGLLEQI